MSPISPSESPLSGVVFECILPLYGSLNILLFKHQSPSVSAAPISWVLAVQKLSDHTLQLGSVVGGARPVHMLKGEGKTGCCAIDNHTLVLSLRLTQTHTQTHYSIFKLNPLTHDF